MHSNKAETILNSLRSRVWLAVCGLALANFLAGLAAYLISTLLLTNPLIPLVAAFSLSTIVTLLYGRWLADEVVRPVKKVNLAAKSIERNPTAPLPSATGSSETDEILFSLQRNNRQFVNLITLMERVAAGDTEAATLPLDSSDRLSSSFQKLVVKVTESIDALEQLAAIQMALRSMTAELRQTVGLRPSLQVSSLSPHTADLTQAVNAVMENLSAEVRQTRSDIGMALPIAEDAAARVMASRETAEKTVEALNKAISAVKASASDSQNASAGPNIGLAEARSAMNFPRAAATIREAAERAGQPRRHAAELQRLMRKLRERSLAFGGILRSVEDITRRVKLITLNTSLSGSSSGAIEPLIDEFKLLSERGERVKKEIVDLERSIATEIGDCEAAVREMAADSSDLHIATGGAAALLSEMEPAIAYLAKLPAQISAAAESFAHDREQVLRSVSSGYFDLEKCIPTLRTAEQKVHALRETIMAGNSASLNEAADESSGLIYEPAPADISSEPMGTNIDQ
jgi:hypothetical protein